MRQEQPFFSIVIPTYARPGQLAACLQSLARLDYPRDRFEVIVVDDGSDTSPNAVVTPFHDQIDVTLLTQAHAGPAAARNTGAGGQTLNALPDNPYSTASQLLIAYLRVYYGVEPHQARFFTSNNLALRAKHFHAIGGFDTTFPRAAGEDREFCDRWLYHGYRMTYAPEVLVYHTHVLTFRTFWRQHFNYGCGAFRFRQARAQRAHGRIRLEPRSFYLNLLHYPFSQARDWRAPLLAALLVVSQVANATGFLWEGVNGTSK
jgi:GT2 family glycosyltransferase